MHLTSLASLTQPDRSTGLQLPLKRPPPAAPPDRTGSPASSGRQTCQVLMLAHLSRIPDARPDRSTGLQLPPKRPAQQRPEQLLRLAQGLALLGAEAFALLDDLGQIVAVGAASDRHGNSCNPRKLSAWCCALSCLCQHVCDSLCLSVRTSKATGRVLARTLDANLMSCPWHSEASSVITTGSRLLQHFAVHDNQDHFVGQQSVALLILLGRCHTLRCRRCQIASISLRVQSKGQCPP